MVEAGAREVERLPRLQASAAWEGLGVALYAGGAASLHEHQHASLQLLTPCARRRVQGQWRAGARPVRFALGAEEVCVVAGGLPHAFAWEQDAQVVSLFLEPQRLATLLQQPHAAQALAALGPARRADPVLRELMRALGEALREAQVPSRVELESLATVLGLRLLRLDGQRAHGAQPGLAAWQVQRVGEFMDAHLAEALGLEALAAVVGLSASHFARSFKRATGHTPHRFLLARRLERARSLLEHSALTLSEVAHAAGFADQSHFTAHFRAHHGLTPARYRRERSSGAPRSAARQ